MQARCSASMEKMWPDQHPFVIVFGTLLVTHLIWTRYAFISPLFVFVLPQLIANSTEVSSIVAVAY